MAALTELALAFIAGAAIEAVAVFWLHYSERGAAARAAACSILQASAQVVGIGESLRSPALATAFVLGYGVGTYVAVRLKSRPSPRE